MDKNINPFNPGAGVSPPELAGRSEVLDSAETALERTKRGRHAKSLMIGIARGWEDGAFESNQGARGEPG